MNLYIDRPAPLLTVQDLGRPGLRRYGVPVGGALDNLSAMTSNWLIGNEDLCAVLEFHGAGPALHLDVNAMIAVTGSEIAVRIGEVAAQHHRPLFVPAYSAIEIGAMTSGCWGYLAVSGGIEVPTVLGGRGTYLSGGFGGLEGRTLQRGDILPIGPNPWGGDALNLVFGVNASAPGFASSWGAFPCHPSRHFSSPKTFRVIEGREFNQLDSDSQSRFLHDEFAISSTSNRIGYRLTGQPLNRTTSKEMSSTAMVPGTVQLPPDGQPIVLMADGGTVGGYARIAHVVQADLAEFAQLRPGNKTRFRVVTLEEARNALLAQQRELARQKYALRAKWNLILAGL